MSPATAIALGQLGGLGVLDLEGLWTRYEDPSRCSPRSPALRRRRRHPADAGDLRRADQARAGHRRGSPRSAPRASPSPARSPRSAPRSSAKTVVDAGVDLFVIRGTTVSAEHVSRPGRAAEPQAVHLRARRAGHRRRRRDLHGGAAPHAHRRGRRARRLRRRRGATRPAPCSASTRRWPRRSPTSPPPAATTSTSPAAATCTSSPTAAWARSGDIVKAHRLRRRRRDARRRAGPRHRRARPRLPLGPRGAPPRAAPRRAGRGRHGRLARGDPVRPAPRRRRHDQPHRRAAPRRWRRPATPTSRSSSGSRSSSRPTARLTDRRRAARIPGRCDRRVATPWGPAYPRSMSEHTLARGPLVDGRTTPSRPQRGVRAGPESVAALTGRIAATTGRRCRASPLTVAAAGPRRRCRSADDVARPTPCAPGAAAWARTALGERAAVLLRLHDLVLDRQDEILDLIAARVGQGPPARLRGGRCTSRSTARYYARTRAPATSTPSAGVGVVPGAHPRSRCNRVPKGVVGIISPWNYPLHAGAHATALPALLAGNAVVAKPDAQTTLSALLGAQLLEEAGFPQDLWQVVLGAGRSSAPAIIDDADYVCFTGSTATGRMVAERAARAADRLLARARRQEPDAGRCATPTSSGRPRAPSGRASPTPASCASRSSGCSWPTRSTTGSSSASWPAPRR